jgi:hypothetical protein
VTFWRTDDAIGENKGGNESEVRKSSIYEVRREIGCTQGRDIEGENGT